MHTRKHWRAAAATALLLVAAFAMTACAPGPLGELTLPGAGSTATTGAATPAQPSVQQPKGLPPASYGVAPPMGFWAVWGPRFRVKADADSVVTKLAARGFPVDLV